MPKNFYLMFGCGGTAIGISFLMEPLFPLGDWRWLFVIAASWIPAVVAYRTKIKVRLVRVISTTAFQSKEAETESPEQDELPLPQAQNHRNKLKDATKHTIALLFIATIAPPIMWATIPTMIPFFELFYIMLGALISFGPWMQVLFGSRLNWAERIRFVLGIMMVATPKIMTNYGFGT